MSNQSFESALSAACQGRTPEQAERFRQSIAMSQRESDRISMILRDKPLDECVDAEIEDADSLFESMPGYLIQCNRPQSVRLRDPS